MSSTLPPLTQFDFLESSTTPQVPPIKKENLIAPSRSGWRSCDKKRFSVIPNLPRIALKYEL